MNIDIFEQDFLMEAQSPFNYTGSKYKIIKQLKQYYPKDIVNFYDVCCGGGSVFVNSQFPKIYANDIIKPLIEFYKWLHVTEWDQVIMVINERNIPKDNHEAYSELRNRYNEKEDFIDFFILCCSCTNNMMRFNQKFKFNQTWGKRHFNKSTEGKLQQYHKRIFKNNDICFINRSLYDIQFEPNSFIYIDPPYWITEAGYNCYWSKTDECNMYAFLDKLDSMGLKFMFSNVSEHKGIVNPYLEKLKKYKIIDLEHDYNKVSRDGKTSSSKEIIVINY